MALTGTWNHYTYSDHPTETEEAASITYAANLPEDHPDYEKRGTTEYETIPKKIEEVTLYENVYLILSGVTIQKSSNIVGSTGLILSYSYYIYNSQEDRDNDTLFENSIYTNSNSTNYDSEIIVSNPYVLAYEHINSLRGYEALSSDE